MRDTELLQMALGLRSPWLVTRSAFDAEDKRLDIYLDFPRGSGFPCPSCGAGSCAAYDTEEVTWRHLNFFQHEAYLHARVPRITCQARFGTLGQRGQRLHAAVRGPGHGDDDDDAGGRSRPSGWRT